MATANSSSSQAGLDLEDLLTSDSPFFLSKPDPTADLSPSVYSSPEVHHSPVSRRYKIPSAKLVPLPSSTTLLHSQQLISLPPTISPTPTYTRNRHISFLSWVSGRGSTSGQDSSKNSSVNFCRICHEGESGGEALISPCRCSGSVGLIHRSCIEKWLSTAQHDTCELCRQKYYISRHPRPFTSWLCEPIVGDDQRNLVGDGVCFLLLTPLAGISAYLCASGAAFYFEQAKKSEAIGLICLAALLVTIYMVWLFMSIRYHCQVWFKWRSANQEIRLLEVSGQRPVRTRDREHKPRSREVFEDDETRNIPSRDSTDQATAVLVNTSVPVEVANLCDIIENVSTDLTGKCAEGLVEDCSEEQAEETEADIKANTPLSPCIISQDPQQHSHTKVVHVTDESEIYAQLFSPTITASQNIESSCNSSESSDQASKSQSRINHQLKQVEPIHLTRTVSAPYLPDLKEHFIALRSRQDVSSMSFKSRGTFSPSNQSGSSTFSHGMGANSIRTATSMCIPVPEDHELRSRPLPLVPGSLN